MRVEPLLPTGGRLVRIRGEQVGIARKPSDVMRFMESAGFSITLERLDDSMHIEWIGGGIETW